MKNLLKANLQTTQILIKFKKIYKKLRKLPLNMPKKNRSKFKRRKKSITKRK